MDSQSIQQQLSALLDEKQIRRCMLKYMALCDELGPDSDLDELMSLFSQDAIWEGKGSRYAKTFGRYQGQEEIRKMFSKYTVSPGHFAMNLHVLGNEQIDVDGQQGFGSWMLVQPSDFSDGRSQLSCAAITAHFSKCETGWVISHFQTENRFSRPMNARWNNQQELPVPK